MMKEKFLAALLAVVLTVLALPIGSVATVEPPIDVSRNTATAKDATDYRSFYVTDGLVLLLDAMSEEAIEATLSTETGHWYSALAGSSRYARLENGALTKNGWSVRTLFGRTCGVGYDQTVSEAHLGRTDGLKNESTPGLDLGYDNLPGPRKNNL